MMAFVAVTQIYSGAIHNAARDGRLDEVKIILEQDGSQINARNEYEKTPLIVASGIPATIDTTR